ncbi:hypothetical protein DER45DRAFT_537385 [Fusarium avenaceum]|nr:hypothetical protein DER45DRAFT_537385 [Fusarium avenaceum]
MRATTVFGIVATLFASVNAKPHGACGCQINTDGALDDDTTDTCCKRFGGTTSFLTTSRNVRFAGKYLFISSSVNFLSYSWPGSGNRSVVAVLWVNVYRKAM